MVKKISVILFVLAISVSLVSCDWHSVDLGGAMHKEGYRYPLTQCSDCHGEDLEGKAGAPSCYDCHDKNWE
jgi:cytochrome c553